MDRITASFTLNIPAGGRAAAYVAAHAGTEFVVDGYRMGRVIALEPVDGGRALEVTLELEHALASIVSEHLGPLAKRGARLGILPELGEVD